MPEIGGAWKMIVDELRETNRLLRHILEELRADRPDHDEEDA